MRSAPGLPRVLSLKAACLAVIMVAACTQAPAAPPAAPAAPANPQAAAPAAPAASPAANAATKPGAPDPKTGALPNRTPDPQKKPSGTFTIASLAPQSETFDPTLTSTTAQNPQLVMFYWGLVETNQAGTEMSPARSIAEKWEASDDKKTWTWHLRADAAFHDGSPITCEDVKFSTIRALTGRQAGQSDLAGWFGKEPQIDCPNPKTVVYKLAQPSFWIDMHNWPFRSTWGAILPKAYVDKVGMEKFLADPLGSGPYKLKEYRSGAGFTMEAFPNHPVLKPRFEQVQYQIVPEESSRLALLRTKKADLVTNVSFDQVAKLKDEGFAVINSQLPNIWGISFNEAYKDDVLSKKEVRRAILLAFDKEALCKAFYAGQCTYDTNFILRSRGVKPRAAIPYDPAEAKRLVKENVPPGYELTFYAVAQYGIQPQHIEAAAAMLTDAGFKVKLIPMPYGTFREKMVAGTLGPAIMNWGTERYAGPYMPSVFLMPKDAGGWNYCMEQPTPGKESLRCRPDLIAKLSNSKSYDEFVQNGNEVADAVWEDLFGGFGLFDYPSFVVANPEALPEWGWEAGFTSGALNMRSLTYP